MISYGELKRYTHPATENTTQYNMGEQHCHSSKLTPDHHVRITSIAVIASAFHMNL